MANESEISKRRYNVLLIVGMVGALAGCASGSPPVDAISAADLAVNRAVEADAERHAPMELRGAMDKLDHAKQASEDEEYKEAQKMAEEARAEARVAEAKARSEKVRMEAQELQRTVDDLRQEINRESYE